MDHENGTDRTRGHERSPETEPGRRHQDGKVKQLLEEDVDPVPTVNAGRSNKVGRRDSKDYEGDDPRSAQGRAGDGG